jgi:hypothetical protein
MTDWELESLRQRRRRMKEEYGALYGNVEALLFRHDPVGINYEENKDEYELETSLLLPRLRNCGSSADVTRMIHQVFMECFSPVSAGPEQHYESIGAEIWQLWLKYRELTPPA